MKSAYAIAFLSILGGLLVHLMVFLVIQIEGPIPKAPFVDQHSVKFIGNLNKDAAPSVIQQAELNDSAPLFMPTRWNLASEMSKVASLQSATEIFEPFKPRLSLSDSTPVPPFQNQLQNASSGSRLPSGSAFVLSRFGRSPLVIHSPSAGGASFRVNQVDLTGHEKEVSDTLPPKLSGSVPESLWNPVQMFLHLQGGFPVGLPLVAQSSGFVDWDTSLQDFFTDLGFYRRLKDGYYQIWVYP